MTGRERGAAMHTSKCLGLFVQDFIEACSLHFSLVGVVLRFLSSE